MDLGASFILPPDLAQVVPTRRSRSISFENPTGAPGAGGQAHGGRKGSPARVIAPGERVVLADVEGPGVARHLWMTFHPAPPEVMRAMTLEVFYDGADSPSVSVPAVDFFGVPWGRPVHLSNALTAISEGRGFNSYVPMPWRRRFRLEFVNASVRKTALFYQLDYTLEDVWDERAGYLHASFRRESPTVAGRDFVIHDGLRGPGRFLGSVVGVRVLDGGVWYGEGEVKMYLDGDGDLPTICGTGLEDYVGSAWGMGAHQTLYAGAPLDVRQDRAVNPDWVGFYRWHVLDPVMFGDELKVTIQQIGYEVFGEGEAEALAARVPAGSGWTRPARPGVLAAGIAERVDDYCATAFVYCAEPQAVAPVDTALATAGVERLAYERASGFEALLEGAID